jgi:hypothetical protein
MQEILDNKEESLNNLLDHKFIIRSLIGKLNDLEDQHQKEKQLE